MSKQTLRSPTHIRCAAAIGAVLAVGCGASMTNEPWNITRLDVLPPPAALAVGDSVQLIARGYGPGGWTTKLPIRWENRVAGVVRVDPVTGWVVGQAPGSAVVGATSRGFADSVTVLVVPASR